MLLRLDEEKLRGLEQLLGTGESITFRDPNFLQKVSERLQLDLETAGSAVLVSQFLLTVVEEGNPPDEILDDVRSFLEQFAAEETGLLTAFDARRKTLFSLLTPKPERSRALKIRYLRGVHPVADSFRSVCELRPVFDTTAQGEEIVGYVPMVLLEVKQSDEDGNESRLVLNLSPALVKDLVKVIQRAEDKLAAIRHRFGEELLGDENRV